MGELFTGLAVEVLFTDIRASLTTIEMRWSASGSVSIAIIYIGVGYRSLGGKEPTL